MDMRNQDQKQKQRMGSVLIFVGGFFFAFVAIVGTCFYQGAQSAVTNECKSLCEALNQTYIEATAYGCVCQSVDGERHIHTGIVGYEGQ